MTEDEAKTKWCPFSRVETFDAQGGLSGGNRGGGITSCLGSACMAWRWGVQHPHGGWIEFVPRPEMTEEQKADPANRLGGYCGLAGRP